MQTFIPFHRFRRTMQCLDNQRLGKQRVETAQILLCNLVIPDSDGAVLTGWRNHPAVKMWHGHEVALAHYGIASCIEWKRRGYTDRLMGGFVSLLRLEAETAEREGKPTWSYCDGITTHRTWTPPSFAEHSEPMCESAIRMEKWATSPHRRLICTGLPDWYGRSGSDVHRTHRAVLYQKLPNHYHWFRDEWESVADDTGNAHYLWPVP